MKYKFEIQNCIKVEAEAEDMLEARRKIINNLNNGFYDDELSSDAYVSDGEEVDE